MEEMEDTLICAGGATTTLTKSLHNCSEVKPKIVDIQTAQCMNLMSTTHVCFKTYYVRDRLGDIRPIIVKEYVVSSLKHDLLSVKSLNNYGYQVIHNKDREESGVFAVYDKKIDKSKSFAFMSKHSNLFFLKLKPMNVTQLEKQSGYDWDIVPT
jgi:hypothetical protein